ncbi:hypothetical protein [Pelagibacterium halotolerans]|uniref:hypothetical protein n=1 Tax=Pelagibacterium halotolerans TaxID=531813 RepID=UPI00384E7AB6
MSNAASQYFASVQGGPEGVYAEMVVMDAVGLSVAPSMVTSDYWQGDEANAIHVG